MPPCASHFVVAITATFQRPLALARMLKALSAMEPPVAAVVVVDNAGDSQTQAVCEAPHGSLEVVRVVPGTNLGCGGGLEYGEGVALERYPQATHFWIMDDDAEATPGALRQMLAAMEKAGAVMAYPMVVDGQGHVNWFPGLISREAFRAVRSCHSPDEYVAVRGLEPEPFSWACGVALLVARRGLEENGRHRGDFWIRGEDLEFSLRLTHRALGLFVPGALVRHLPPPPRNVPGASQGLMEERRKHWFMLRNSTYIALRLPHGRRILRSIPGNFVRFVKAHGLRSLPAAIGAVWDGTRGCLGPLPPAPEGKLNLVFSLADQHFATTKSVGILNVSTSLARCLAASPRVSRLLVLGNSTVCLGDAGSGFLQVLHCNWVIRNKLTRLIWNQWGVYSSFKTRPEDWLFLPKGFSPLYRTPPCHLAAYVHDAMLFFYAARYPGRMPWLEGFYFRQALCSTLEHANVIFTNSEFTRREVLEVAAARKLPPPPILPVGIGFQPPGEIQAKKNQILFLASKWPHKLTVLALEFVESWQQETNYDGEVIWIGSMARTVQLRNYPNWKYFSRLPEKTYREIFNQSRAVVFFSDYEGFGMPPVEAALCGAAPVYSNIPAICEGMNHLGFPFDNGSYKSFVQALENGLNCPQSQIEEWGRKLAQIHSWTEVTEKIQNAFTQIEAHPRTKLLVFAHVPPPYHGQSYMVKLMLEGFARKTQALESGEFQQIACYHVNSRVSGGMEDIGAFRAGKVFQIIGYILEALYKRVRFGVSTFYYIPAPGKRVSLYRDWLVMALCRPFFRKIVFHWHASGLCAWLERDGMAFERWITRKLLGSPDLSIVLAEASSADARWLGSKKIEVVPNGIADPCPDFNRALLPVREARARARAARLAAGEEAEPPLVMRVLFMAHCIREKGLFDALEGVARFNREQRGLQIHFTVAGAFMDAGEEREFRQRVAQLDLASVVTYVGFVSGDAKRKLMTETDLLCFPTYYTAESFPLTVVEALAYGIPVVATTWRAIPEILPEGYPGFVQPRAPEEIAGAFSRLAGLEFSAQLRERFLERFSLQSHLWQLATAIETLRA